MNNGTVDEAQRLLAIIAADSDTAQTLVAGRIRAIYAGTTVTTS